MAIALRDPETRNAFTAPDGKKLAQEVRRRGDSPESLFFKCDIRFAHMYEKEFPHFQMAYSYSYFSKFPATVEDEFIMLSTLHDMFPDNVAQPVGAVARNLIANNTIGYLSEYVEGRMLRDYLLIRDGPKELGKSMIELFEHQCQALKTLIWNINSAGFAHGDSFFHNVIVAPDDRLVLIDPLPITDKYGNLDLDLLIRRDIHQMKRVDEYLEYLHGILRN